MSESVRERHDDEHSPRGLYRRAEKMETELRRMMDRDPHALLPDAYATDFNQLLEEARQLVPQSVALAEDVKPIDASHELAADYAWRAVNITLLPTLHNALPDTDYDAV